MAVTVWALISLLVSSLAASPSVYFPPDVSKPPSPYPLKPSGHPRPFFKSYTLVPPSHAHTSTRKPQQSDPLRTTPRAHAPTTTAVSQPFAQSRNSSHAQGQQKATVRKHSLRKTKSRPRPSSRRPTPSVHPPPTYYLHGVYDSYPTHISLPRSRKHPKYPSHIVYSLEPPQDPQLSYLVYEPAPPLCSANTTKPWCVRDLQYPMDEVTLAAAAHYEKMLTLYTDVANLNTHQSVDLPTSQTEETYLCPSETAYVRPLRAINTEGKWRVIVNGIKVHYETFTQTTRLEECLNPGYACPLVPQCYESKCLQKSIYHRFLVYDPYDQYFPFAVETFKLPASCACLLGASTLDH
ncbi:uncharacterized protein LOC123508926 [Portunus trituberculatus]|uniref:uncharacterized protein LOC123508926 n=1 Tax=Portunus trituberculatus TaxID=210409 RepID=UPI001E1CC94A|nr:uncharacterized protein LOC123508926 [Portunus trituberculatus]